MRRHDLTRDRRLAPVTVCKESVAVGIEKIRRAKAAQPRGEGRDDVQARLERWDLAGLKPERAEVLEQGTKDLFRIRLADGGKAVHPARQLAHEGLRVAIGRRTDRGLSDMRHHDGAAQIVVADEAQPVAVICKDRKSNRREGGQLQLLCLTEATGLCRSGLDSVGGYSLTFRCHRRLEDSVSGKRVRTLGRPETRV